MVVYPLNGVGFTVRALGEIPRTRSLPLKIQQARLNRCNSRLNPAVLALDGQRRIRERFSPLQFLVEACTREGAGALAARRQVRARPREPSAARPSRSGGISRRAWSFLWLGGLPYRRATLFASTSGSCKPHGVGLRNQGIDLGGEGCC